MKLSAVLREPLVHFALAGLALFVLNAGVGLARAKDDRTVRVTPSDVTRLAALYTSESGNLPGDAEMQAMISDHVRDEVLAREARRLGLDANDTIITRRLAQKMTFMVSDLAEVKPPDEATLRAWQAAHSARFMETQRVGFVHVFLSRDTRGAQALADAEALKATLNVSLDKDAWRQSGDAFILQREFGATPIREISRQFGPEFSEALSRLTVSENWQGPIISALGVHLVRLDTLTPARALSFDEARKKIEADYLQNAEREANEAAIAELMARYEIEIEGVP